MPLLFFFVGFLQARGARGGLRAAGAPTGVGNHEGLVACLLRRGPARIIHYVGFYAGDGEALILLYVLNALWVCYVVWVMCASGVLCCVPWACSACTITWGCMQETASILSCFVFVCAVCFGGVMRCCMSCMRFRCRCVLDVPYADFSAVDLFCSYVAWAVTREIVSTCVCCIICGLCCVCASGVFLCVECAGPVFSAVEVPGFSRYVGLDAAHGQHWFCLCCPRF